MLTLITLNLTVGKRSCPKLSKLKHRPGAYTQPSKRIEQYQRGLSPLSQGLAHAAQRDWRACPPSKALRLQDKRADCRYLPLLFQEKTSAFRGLSLLTDTSASAVVGVCSNDLCSREELINEQGTPINDLGIILIGKAQNSKIGVR